MHRTKLYVNIKKIYIGKVSIMKLTYELINNENIYLATAIQHTIFPEECAYIHYKYAIDTNYENNKYYMIKYNQIPVGVIGLYINNQTDTESIWLGWFGILPEFRSKGIGKKSLLDIIEEAKKYSKKYFRLYTNDDGTSTARPLYQKVMQISEKYRNEEDDNYNGNCLVYSYSLCDEKVKPWNNRFLNLKEDKEQEKIGNNLWDDKHRILILSNKNNEEFIEDEYLATAFRKDGHLVTVRWIDYEENLDEKFDIIIRRNTWVARIEETKSYEEKNKILVERLKKKNVKTVNMEGVDGNGKGYLCKLYKEGRKVIPTVDTIEDALKMPAINEYVLKDKKSMGSGLGQKIVKKEELAKQFQEGYLIQPKLSFKSEVQCYFVGQKFMYAYGYTPSKYPDYPTPRLIQLKEAERNLACEFAQASGLEVGFQRIDFLKLENDQLILLEIEDNSPHMSLEELEEAFRDRVMDEYKKNIYQYLQD